MTSIVKRALTTTAAAAVLSLGAGAVAAEGDLVIYHWFEYIPQELLDKFSEEYDVNVVMDTYDSNESLLAALKAGIPYVPLDPAHPAARREAALTRAVEQSQSARELAEDRYARGLDGIITLLSAQRDAFRSESQLLQIQRLRLDARIDLHLALGGGFSHTGGKGNSPVVYANERP